MSQVKMEWQTYCWLFMAANLASAINQSKVRHERMGLIGRFYVTFEGTKIQVNP
jgi:hypothetical protein